MRNLPIWTIRHVEIVYNGPVENVYDMTLTVFLQLGISLPSILLSRSVQPPNSRIEIRGVDEPGAIREEEIGCLSIGGSIK